MPSEVVSAVILKRGIPMNLEKCGFNACPEALKLIMNLPCVVKAHGLGLKVTFLKRALTTLGNNTKCIQSNSQNDCPLFDPV